MNPRYAPMFAPYTLNNDVAIKNRFVLAPLTIYESDANGGLTDAARNFWRDRFRGFGLFVMPFTNVHPTKVNNRCVAQGAVGQPIDTTGQLPDNTTECKAGL